MVLRELNGKLYYNEEMRIRIESELSLVLFVISQILLFYLQNEIVIIKNMKKKFLGSIAV